MKPWRILLNWLDRHLVLIIGVLVLVYMFIPVGVVVAMSFNTPPSRNVYEFGSFTWNNWIHPCEPYGMCEALWRSVEIGVLATVCATFLGTLMAFALVRHRFAGRSAASLLVLLPMATPEIVMGSSRWLITSFIAANTSGCPSTVLPSGKAIFPRKVSCRKKFSFVRLK